MPYGDQRVLAALGHNSTAFVGPAPPRAQALDLQNVPGMNSQMGMIMSMALQPLITQMASNMGYAGLQFSGTQNLYDRYHAQDFFMESRKAVMEASRRDQDVYFKQLLGVARLTGTNINADTERAARTMAGDLAKMGTVMGDMMPDFFDEMHGVRGSSAVMARRVHLGGRYAFDPFTGQLGMSGESAGMMSSRIYDNLFGDKADLRAMRGFGAGRVGGMYDELQRRGFLGGQSATREESFYKLAQNAGMNPMDYAQAIGTAKLGMTDADFAANPQSAIDKVMGSSETREQITRAQADRISSRLKNLVGAVSAMRDIFGDMGKADAPMVELINGLQALTQGGLATMQPATLEKVVRSTQQLGRMAGMSMEGMMQFMSRGAGLSDQMGLDRSYSIFASQGAVAFATAFGSSGGASTPGWRALDKDSMMALDQNLRLNAARSDMASQFNASLRIADELGVGNPKFAGSEFAAMAEALRKGDFSYEFGNQKRSVAMSFDKWADLAASAGIDRNVAYNLRTYSAANQEYGSRYNTGDLVRLLQRDVSINPILQIQGDMAFSGLGLGGDQRSLLVARAIELMHGSDINGQAIVGGLTSEDRRDPTKRYDKLMSGLTAFANKNGMQVDQGALRQAIVSMWTGGEQRFAEDQSLQGYNGMIGMFDAQDPKTLAMGRQNLARANDRARLSSAMSGIGRVGPLRRFMSMLETTDGSGNLGDLAKKLIVDVFAGGVKSKELEGALTDMEKEYRAYQSADPNTPEGRARRDEAVRNLHDISMRAREAAVKEGLTMDTTPEDTAGRLMNAIGRGGEAINPELVSRLKSPESRKKAMEMADAYMKMQSAIKGKGLSPLAGGDADKIKELIGPDQFDKIQPLLKAIEAGKIEEAVAPANKEPTQVSLRDPIQLEGRVRIDGDWLLFDDVQGANHKLPVERT
jgi:hypothetical protein